jgi:hypothetical protein
VTIDAALMNRLRALVGRRCAQQGEVWRLIDVLPSEGLVILESERARPPIQTDQYGRPSHRANEILQVPILADTPSGLTDTLVELMDCLEPRQSG